MKYKTANYTIFTLLYAHFDRPSHISASILNRTMVRSPTDRLVDPHELLQKRAPANVRGVWCGFLKNVNWLSPEADRQLLPVSSLRMRVCIAVPKLPQYVFM